MAKSRVGLFDTGHTLPRILVIDGDPKVRKTLSDILRLSGYEVVNAESGAAGLAEAQRVFVNLAVIALGLPDMSGIDVMTKIKAGSQLTEVIILTGHASLDTAIDATSKGAFSYLIKPYETDKLLRHIRRALDRQQIQQEMLRLASFPRMSPDPIIELGSSGKVTYLNPAAEKLFPDLVAMGSAHPVLHGVADTFAVFCEDESREIVRQIDVGNLVFEQRISFVPESGLIRIYVLDITERVRAETALSESEQRFKAIIENAQDGILLADLAAKKFYSGNPRICEMLGYSPEEIASLNVADIHPEDDLSYVLELFEKQARKEISLAQEVPVKTKSGKTFFADINSFPITLQGKEYLVGFFRDITERKAQELKNRKLNELLLILRDINEYLLNAENEASLFKFVCEALSRLEDIATVWVMLREPQLQIMPVAWAGVAEAEISALRVRWDDAERGIGFIINAIQQRKPVVARDLKTDTLLPAWQKMLRQRNVKSAVAVPIYAESEIFATLAVFSHKPDAFDEEFVKFLDEIAGDIAIGVRSLRLDKNLHSTLEHLRESMNSTVEAISRMVELRDPYTAGHERRVAQLASAIGKEMGLPKRQVEGLRVTGYLHDIGKIAVPAEILSKPTKLTEIELALVSEHAKAGYNILKGLEFPWPVAQAVLQHHERLDGSGYPLGIKDGEIILEARILMVADVVEAMASHRPYRSALGVETAFAEITANRGKLYDEQVVDACIKLFAEKKFMFE